MQDIGLNTQLRLANLSFIIDIIDTHQKPLQIKLVILISIDSPIPPFPNFPRLTIQLWRSFPPDCTHCPQAASQQRVTQPVWEADWTHTTTPFYILLSDIFRGPPPAAYAHHDRVFLNTKVWREIIFNDYQWLYLKIYFVLMIYW